MTDERRWTIYVCEVCGDSVDDCPCEPDWDGNEPKVREVEVVPLAALRAAIEQAVIDTADDGKNDLLRAIRALLDEYEVATE